MTDKANSNKDCTSQTKNPIITLEGKGKESGKKMVFHNKGRKVVFITLVDGCAIISGSKCDYLVKNENEYECFVELKGNDVLYACEQLIASIKQLGINPTHKSKHSFVVASRVSPAITTRLQNLKITFKRNFNCTLIVKNKYCEFDF